MKRVFGALALALIVPMTPLCAAGLKPEDLQKAARYSAECRGESLLVIKRGRVLFEQYPNGHAAGDAHKIFSGTKAFWTLAALAAVEDGRLDLDERVGATLPEWRSDPRKSLLTVRALLDFSCGLDPAFGLHANSFGNRNRAALGLPLVAEPGRAFIYGPSALQVFHEVLKRKLAGRGETPTEYLEQRVLRPMGLGSQRYLADRAGNPLLASGWLLTAREWAKMGRVVLAGGAPIVSRSTFSACFRGSGANAAFSLGWWNNHAAPGGREFDFEDMLERDWPRQDWRHATLCRAAPSDLVASIGSGYQRLFVIPSLDLIAVRQGAGGKFSDGHFLRLLLGE
jgi:CubicO group peptidase (beta-lactamase class C family)